MSASRSSVRAADYADVRRRGQQRRAEMILRALFDLQLRAAMSRRTARRARSQHTTARFSRGRLRIRAHQPRVVGSSGRMIHVVEDRLLHGRYSMLRRWSRSCPVRASTPPFSVTPMRIVCWPWPNSRAHLHVEADASDVLLAASCARTLEPVRCARSSRRQLHARRSARSSRSPSDAPTRHRPPESAR